MLSPQRVRYTKAVAAATALQASRPAEGGRLDHCRRRAEALELHNPGYMLLEKKRAQGVSVLVLTNSLRSTDGLLPQAAYLKYRRGLVRAGMDVREYKGPDVLHAKSVFVDGRIAMIGSYNIDPRSRYMNTEVMAVAEDEDVARELRRSIDEHLEHTWTIHRSASGPRVSRATSLRLFGARLLLPLIEPQL